MNYAQKFLFLVFLGNFVTGFTGFCGGKFNYNPVNLVSPVSAVNYEKPSNYQIYGTGENPKYEEPGDRGATGGTARQNRLQLSNTSNQGSRRVEEIQRYICSKPWPCATAKRIVACESSWNSQAKNRQGSTAGGLWQFTAGTWKWVRGKMGVPVGSRFDPYAATDTAYYLYSMYGFNHRTSWAASYKCWSKII